MRPIRIVAVGGGGCTHGTDPALEDFLLGVCKAHPPRIGYIGAASDNDPEKIRRFRARFEGKAELANVLATDASAETTKLWLKNLDAVYVGGGNTAKMLDIWRASGTDRTLSEAARQGVVFGGISAGAACWFEEMLFDNGSSDYRLIKGLGIVKGSCCVHYSSEPERKAAFRRAIANGDIKSGIAIDDGVAVLCGDAGAETYLSARAGHAAYSVERSGNDFKETKLSGSAASSS
jgi:peptidase E